MKYICNECGAVFDKIPRVYRGFSGDHFGGSETMLPGCTHCGKYDFSQYTDDGHREILDLREQIKVLREALEWLDNEMDCRDDEFGGCLFSRHDFGIVREALEQTKPKDEREVKL